MLPKRPQRRAPHANMRRSHCESLTSPRAAWFDGDMAMSASYIGTAAASFVRPLRWWRS